MLLLPILFKVEKKALGYLNGTNLKTSCVILFLQELDKLVIYYVFFQMTYLGKLDQVHFDPSLGCLNYKLEILLGLSFKCFSLFHNFQQCVIMPHYIFYIQIHVLHQFYYEQNVPKVFVYVSAYLYWLYFILSMLTKASELFFRPLYLFSLTLTHDVGISAGHLCNIFIQF